MTRLRFRSLAERDLGEIGDYIGRENPLRAYSFVQELRAHCEKISQAPQAYRRRPELGEDVRSCPHGQYVIYFREVEGGVVILSIRHAARDNRAFFAS